ncbi:MAG TPA: hypothetical protein VFV38_43595 [Ktedonobacteraceae bacterium]|nr:hypothetical protein [Ktedonobacteraceae bacterium]
MSRVIVMKNGDIVCLESYDWPEYRSLVLINSAIHELVSKAAACQSRYPGQAVRFCFNSEYGEVPQVVKTALEAQGIVVERWP